MKLASQYALSEQYFLRLLFAVSVITSVAPYIQMVTFKAFVMDDAVAVQRNPNVVSPTVTWSDLMRRDFWGLELFAGTWTHKSFRPLTTWTYRLGFLVHGTESVGYHVVSLLLHVVCSFVVGLVARHIIKLSLVWSLVSVALFSTHPIHTENLLYLVGRADILATIFFGLALVVANTSNLALSWAGMTACTVLAGLSKETGFTAPLIAAGITVVNQSQRIPLARIGIQAATGIILMAWRHWFTNGTEVNMSVQDNPVSYEQIWLLRLLSYGFIHAKYFQLLVFPLELCYDYSLTAIAIVREVYDVRCLFTLAGYTGIAACMQYSVRAFTSAGGKNLVICLALMIVPWLPASNILFPVGTVIGERLLYTPSVGFVLFVVAGMSRIKSLERTRIAFAMILVALYAVRTAIRVTDWEDGDTLFIRDGHRQTASSKTQFNLGITHMSNKNYDRAVAALIRCAAADPMSALPYWRIGQIEILRGRFVSAESWLMEASTKFSATLMIRDEEIFHDIAVAVFQNKKWERAHYYLTLALEINKAFPKGLNNYGCLLASRDPSKSIDFLRRAVDLKPGHQLYLDNYAFMAEYSGNVEAQTFSQRLRNNGPLPRRDCVWEFVPAS